MKKFQLNAKQVRELSKEEADKANGGTFTTVVCQGGSGKASGIIDGSSLWSVSSFNVASYNTAYYG